MIIFNDKKINNSIISTSGVIIRKSDIVYFICTANIKKRYGWGTKASITSLNQLKNIKTKNN